LFARRGSGSPIVAECIVINVRKVRDDIPRIAEGHSEAIPRSCSTWPMTGRHRSLSSSGRILTWRRTKRNSGAKAISVVHARGGEAEFAPRGCGSIAGAAAYGPRTFAPYSDYPSSATGTSAKRAMMIALCSGGRGVMDSSVECEIWLGTGGCGGDIRPCRVFGQPKI